MRDGGVALRDRKASLPSSSFVIVGLLSRYVFRSIFEKKSMMAESSRSDFNRIVFLQNLTVDLKFVKMTQNGNRHDCCRLFRR